MVYSIYEVIPGKLTSEDGSPVKPLLNSIAPATTQKIQVGSDGRRFFNEPVGFGKEGNNIGYIAVYSSPLEAPFASSTPNIRSYFQRQFFSVDYHAFIVVRTNYGRWWAVDKMRDGVYLSHGDSRDSVLFYFDHKPRPQPLRILIGDRTDSSEERLFFDTILNRSYHSYEVVSENCQHFCKDIFDKFASSEWWKFSTIVDITSPLLLFTNVSKSKFRIVSCACEIYFLLAEAKVGVQHFFQFLKSKYFLLAYTLLIVLISALMIMELQEVFGGLLHIFGYPYLLLLAIDLFFFGPFSAVKKRMKQLHMKCSSRRDLFKVFLPLVFTFVYTQMIVSFYTVITFAIGDTLLYLVGASASFSVEDFLTHLYHTVGEDNLLILGYLIPFMYFFFSPIADSEQEQ